MTKILKFSDRKIKITMITMLMTLMKKIRHPKSDGNVCRGMETLRKNQKKS